MWLIAGLGNPGVKYALSRHNFGFMVLDRLSEIMQIPFTFQTLIYIFGRKNLINDEIILLKPLTFMNNSGKAIIKSAIEFNVPINRIVVIHDDMDIELGALKIKTGGGSAGHKGIESIVFWLGTTDFIRIRLGIGHPPSDIDPVEYVLQPFDHEEQEKVANSIEKAVQAVNCILQEGVEKAMNKFNARQNILDNDLN